MRSLLLALLLPLLALAGSHLFLLPMYDVNDDPGMDMVARGVGYASAPSPFLWYSNVLYGRCLNLLYGTVPALPWYRVLALAFQYLAGAAIAWTILRRGFSWPRLLLLGLYFAVFDTTFYLHPTFTVTAALVAAAACAIWLDRTLAGEPMRPAALVAFVALVALSAMIRAESAVLMLLVTLPAVLLYAARRKILPLLLAGVTIVALHAYDRHAYRSTPGWEEFHELHGLISEFIDFGRASYTPETRQVFDEVGWSANDFEMLRNWFYADEKRFSVDKMKRVLAAFPRQRPRLDPGLEHLYFVRNDPYVPLMILTVLAAALFVPRRDRRLLGVALLWVGLAVISACMIFVLHRYPPRVYQPLLALAFVLSAVLAGRGAHAPPRALHWARAVALVVLATLVPALVSTWRSRSEFGGVLASAFREALAQLPADRLLVVWGAALPLELTPPLSPMADLRPLKLYSLGSDTRSPLNTARRAEFGIDDVYRAIYARDDVLVIGNDTQNRLLVDYAAEHYGERIAYRPVAHFGIGSWHLFSVYRFGRENG